MKKNSLLALGAALVTAAAVLAGQSLIVKPTQEVDPFVDAL